MSGEILALDAALAAAGEDIILRRTVKRGGVSVDVDVTCRASVRAVSADQIVGTIAATDLNVVISPTQIVNASPAWPGADENTPVASDVDQRLPRITDKAVVQGKVRQAKVSKPTYVNGTWVRCDMVVSG